MITPEEQETKSADPRALLQSLGLLTAEDIEILSKAQTIEGLRKEFRDRDMTCDAEQYLLPMFRPLYQ